MKNPQYFDNGYQNGAQTVLTYSKDMPYLNNPGMSFNSSTITQEFF
jgi:hypothetical protein